MEPTSGQYVYRRQTAAGPTYAEAHVTVELTGRTSVEVSPDALGWMRDVFGGAGIRLTPQELTEVEQGAREGLRAAGSQGIVRVQRLGLNTNDTGPGDLGHAVSRAVQDALSQN